VSAKQWDAVLLNPICQQTVLPYPAGAEISTILPCSPSSRRRVRRERWTRCFTDFGR
jgi:hypothetical protein